MQIAAYEFITDEGRFAISLRPYGRWRVRCAIGLLDRSFDNAEQALAELAAQFAVPPNLKDWTPLPEHSGETMAGALDPTENSSKGFGDTEE